MQHIDTKLPQNVQIFHTDSEKRMTTDKPHVTLLRSLGACDGPGESIEFASQYSDAQSAWEACQRGDWLAW